MSDTYHVHDRLDDYVDGLLPERERDAVRLHLEGCADCGAEAEAIRELQAAARSLPREIAPPRELWSGIAARLESESRPAIEVDFRRPATPWRRWAGAAAAAVLLVAASSGVTAHLMRARGTQVAPVSTLPAAEVRTGVTALAGFRPAEAEFIARVDALERELEARRSQLAPETVAIVEANLRIARPSPRRAPRSSPTPPTRSSRTTSPTCTARRSSSSSARSRCPRCGREMQLSVLSRQSAGPITDD